MHVRASSRRVQPHNTGINTNANNNQQATLSRRDISLLKQMIFMFFTFIGGWTPVYTVLILDQLLNISQLFFLYSVVICEIGMFAITINLFKCNHEIKEYLISKFRPNTRR